MSVQENATNTLDVPISNPSSDNVVAPATVAEVAAASVVSPVSDVVPVVTPAVVEPVVASTNVVVSEKNINNSNKLLGIDLNNNKYNNLLVDAQVKSIVTVLLTHADSVDKIVSTFNAVYPIDLKDIPIIIHVLNKAYSNFDKEKDLVTKLTPVLLLNTVQAILVILIKENKVVVDDPDMVVDSINSIVSGLILIEQVVVSTKCCGLCK
jgi:hypothetical protein